MARTSRGRVTLGLVVLPLTGLAGALLAVGLAIIYYTIMLPHPMQAGQDRRPATIRILGHDGSVIGERGVAREYIPLDMMPRYLPAAVLATEDRRFHDHYGIDPLGLLRASIANLRAGRTVQGGSTITQQLAKNLFLRSDRDLGRKAEEMLIALWLEARLSKAEILELYLNRVYFGAGAHGVESAAERYFGKSARDLTIGEAAVLAGLLKAPSRYSPINNPGLARSRARVVLKKMSDAGVITVQEARAAAAQSVRFSMSGPSRQTTGHEYAVDYVVERLAGVIGATRGDLVVETTIDVGLQRRAQSILRDRMLLEGEHVDATQGAVVVLDPEGAIRALVGGRAHAESQYNRAVKGRRQPGSAFKPFVFLAALESGLSPSSIVQDEPISVAGWTPRNFSGGHKGAVTLADALAQSINAVAVRLYLDVGKRKVVSVARRLGITSDLLDGPSLALGTSEVTTLELTNAYVPFASGGTVTEPHVIRRVITAAGVVVHQAKPVRTPGQIEPRHVGAMNQMMHETLAAGTGRIASIARHAVAGKTGTTQDFRDAWFVGHSAYYVTGVWVGNDDGKSMQGVSGGTLPAKIWREVMTAAHADLAPRPLPGTEIVRPSSAVAAVRPPTSVRPAQPPAAPSPRREQPSPRAPAAGLGAGDDGAALQTSSLPSRRPAERIDEEFLRRVLGDDRSAAR